MRVHVAYVDWGADRRVIGVYASRDAARIALEADSQWQSEEQGRQFRVAKRRREGLDPHRWDVEPQYDVEEYEVAL